MKRTAYLFAGAAAAALSAGLAGSPLYAEKLCVRATNPRGARVDLRTRIVDDGAACPRGFRPFVTAADLIGSVPSIYGDGSAGAKVISANEDLEASFDPNNAPNLQFTDVTINAGQTWNVPSGTVIRCTGTFTNNGTLSVSPAAAGEIRPSDTDSDIIDQGDAPAHSGISARSAGHGQWGNNSAIDLRAGPGGVGLTQSQLSQITFPGSYGGGGGGAGGPDTCANLVGPSEEVNTGASGGGTVTILCEGGIANAGTISADGISGADTSLLFPCDRGGGGGGGVIILASKTSITNSGAIAARGGNGEAPDTNEAASGGGGGGLVKLMAPAVTSSSSPNVAGGQGGAAGGAGTIGGQPSFAGGGGGGSAGSGGSGGSVSGDTTGEAGDGGDGKVIITRTDPTNLF